MSTKVTSSNVSSESGKDIETIAANRYQRLDRDANRLLELYDQIISLSTVVDTKKNERDALQLSVRDGLQLSVYASEYVGLCESLLQLCSELKQGYMLHDFDLLQKLNIKNLTQNIAKEKHLCQMLFNADDVKDRQQAFTELQQSIDVYQLKKKKQVTPLHDVNGNGSDDAMSDDVIENGGNHTTATTPTTTTNTNMNGNSESSSSMDTTQDC